MCTNSSSWQEEFKEIERAELHNIVQPHVKLGCCYAGC